MAESKRISALVTAKRDRKADRHEYIVLEVGFLNSGCVIMQVPLRILGIIDVKVETPVKCMSHTGLEIFPKHVNKILKTSSDNPWVNNVL